MHFPFTLFMILFSQYYDVNLNGGENHTNFHLHNYCILGLTSKGHASSFPN